MQTQNNPWFFQLSWTEARESVRQINPEISRLFRQAKA